MNAYFFVHHSEVIITTQSIKSNVETHKWTVGFLFKKDNHSFFLIYNFKAIFAYLTGGFIHVNGVNIQGRSEDILTSADKLLIFQKRISFWRSYYRKKYNPYISITSNWSNYRNYSHQTRISIYLYYRHSYFSSLKYAYKNNWIRNPFYKGVTSIVENFYCKKMKILFCRPIPN